MSMAAPSEQTEGVINDTQSNQTLDVDEFLKTNKLEHIADVFKRRQIAIEELSEFDDDELDQFMRCDLNLNTLARNRLFKSIKVIQNKNSNNNNQCFVISMEENKAIQKLDHRSMTINHFKDDLNKNGLPKLELSSNECTKQIIQNIDQFISELMVKKTKLFDKIDMIQQNKQNILKNQMINTEQYLLKLSDLKDKYHLNVNDKKSEINTNSFTRKQFIASMLDNIKNDKFSLNLMIEPSMKFSIIEYEFQKLLKTVYGINDCDAPKQVMLKIDKISQKYIDVKLNVAPFDLMTEIGINHVELEWKRDSESKS